VGWYVCLGKGLEVLFWVVGFVGFVGLFGVLLLKVDVGVGFFVDWEHQLQEDLSCGDVLGMCRTQR